VIQLPAIPKRVIVFARQQDPDLTYSSSDVFAGITNLNVKFEVRDGRLASANQQQLYNMSVKNGLKMSWPEFSKYKGSVVAFDFPRDIGLEPVQAPGLMGSFNFQITNATITNLSNSSKTFALYMVIIDEGLVTLEAGRCLTQVGVLTPKDILNVDRSSRISQNELNPKSNLYGGDFWGTLKSFIPDAVSLLPIPGSSLLSRGARAILGNGLSGGRQRVRALKAPQKHRKRNMRGSGFEEQKESQSQSRNTNQMTKTQLQDRLNSLYDECEQRDTGAGVDSDSEGPYLEEMD
jgi:hypothetical protein